MIAKILIFPYNNYFTIGGYIMNDDTKSPNEVKLYDSIYDFAKDADTSDKVKLEVISLIENREFAVIFANTITNAVNKWQENSKAEKEEEKSKEIDLKKIETEQKKSELNVISRSMYLITALRFVAIIFIALLVMFNFYEAKDLSMPIGIILGFLFSYREAKSK